jgi:hypothetical protein
VSWASTTSKEGASAAGTTTSSSPSAATRSSSPSARSVSSAQRSLGHARSRSRPERHFPDSFNTARLHRPHHRGVGCRSPTCGTAPASRAGYSSRAGEPRRRSPRWSRRRTCSAFRRGRSRTWCSRQDRAPRRRRPLRAQRRLDCRPALHDHREPRGGGCRAEGPRPQEARSLINQPGWRDVHHLDGRDPSRTTRDTESPRSGSAGAPIGLYLATL